MTHEWMQVPTGLPIFVTCSRCLKPQARYEPNGWTPLCDACKLRGTYSNNMIDGNSYSTNNVGKRTER